MSQPLNLTRAYDLVIEGKYVGIEFNLGKTTLIVWQHSDKQMTCEVFPETIPHSAIESWEKSGIKRIHA